MAQLTTFELFFYPLLGLVFGIGLGVDLSNGLITHHLTKRSDKRLHWWFRFWLSQSYLGKGRQRSRKGLTFNSIGLVIFFIIIGEWLAFSSDRGNDFAVAFHLVFIAPMIGIYLLMVSVTLIWLYRKS